MIRQLENQSLPLAIRPTEATHALSDLFGMEVSPTQPFGQRFTVLGLDVAGARRLAEGPVPALLPGDLGMIRVDKQLVIDFSQRPFDAIELGRMAALADQLAGIV